MRLQDQDVVTGRGEAHGQWGTMSAEDLVGSTALVTGASRGFGRAIAAALTGAGVRVVGVARDRHRLSEVSAELGTLFTPVVADATGPSVGGHLIDKYRPRALILNAGATPLPRPIQHQTWQTFSRNWEVDVQHVFRWVREALLAPLDPGSVVVALSSGAALGGSPLSGGYAGAKATVRFISSYAASESERLGLGIRFVAVLPQLTPGTDLGAVGVAAYARLEGADVATVLQRFGATLTAERVGELVLDVVASNHYAQKAYLVTAAGLEAV